MPFKNTEQLKKFLEAATFKCKKKDCPYETNEEELFSRHVIEHASIEREDRIRKKELELAKPNKELVNMLGKIIE